MKFTARLHNHVEHSGRAVTDDDYPVLIEVVGGQEHLGFEGSCQPGDEGLILGALGRQGADPYGHQRVAAVLAGEKRLPAAITRAVRAADASTVAGEGVPHD
jgi:hypothetical protein